MVPVPTEDFDIDPPGGSLWQSLLNLAISVLVVCAAALIGSFLSVTTAHARLGAPVAHPDACAAQKSSVVTSTSLWPSRPSARGFPGTWPRIQTDVAPA